MDPVAALAEAGDLIEDGDWAEALDRLAGYFEWRLKGGFQPPRGDERALALQRKICDSI